MHVDALHRYPVKSMAGEPLEFAELGELGVPGDRGWALRDPDGRLVTGKKHGVLMGCHARYTAEPSAAEPPPAALIRLPDGRDVRTGEAEADEAFSKLLDAPVRFSSPAPADDEAHYARRPPEDPDADPQAQLREVFARTPDEPLPDLSTFPKGMFRYQSPPGTYFDAFPLLILSTAALAELARRAPESRFDVRRFRPNLVIETGDTTGFPEDAWAGRALHVGGAVLRVAMPCPRCVMTTRGFDDVPKDPKVMRALVRENAGNLGVYAAVERAGRIAVGDRLELR